jgi:hypothetical protein
MPNFGKILCSIKISLFCGQKAAKFIRPPINLNAQPPEYFKRKSIKYKYFKCLMSTF